MGDFKKLGLIFKFSRLAMLFSLLCIAQMVVLCIGPDGHIEVELPMQQSCGTCIDVPLCYATHFKEAPIVEGNPSKEENILLAMDISVQYSSLTTTDRENRINNVLLFSSTTSTIDTTVLLI